MRISADTYPAYLSHRGYTLERIIYQMYLTSQGVFGMPTGVASTYLVIFVVLGAMLDKSGLAKLFNDVAMTLGGRFTGGPAKVSVIASALLGMIQGSAATNVATTGAFTIPLMKKVGYKPAFAGAVEAAASTGGQFMPPIMGSVAFIMAEFLGVSYLSIAAAAFIPAVLYFAGVFFQIDLRARTMGLKGLDKKDMPDTKHTVLRYGHMILPIIILVYLLFEGRTPLYSAFFAVVTTAGLSWVRKETRMGLPELKAVAVNSARSSLSIGVAMANAGFVVAVLSMTGIGMILADNIVALSGGRLWIALILSMVVSIILGMGLAYQRMLCHCSVHYGSHSDQDGRSCLPGPLLYPLLCSPFHHHTSGSAFCLCRCRNGRGKAERSRLDGFPSCSCGVHRTFLLHLLT
jgi:TRAP transporter 4TM/12TM fusion protein